MPRQRRRPDAKARRRPGRLRAAADPRWHWLLAAALLLALLLLARGAGAQGLRSAAASVSLIAVREVPAVRTVRDIELAAVWPGEVSSIRVRLADAVSEEPLYVRDRTGRLTRVDPVVWAEVDDAPLRFRAVTATPDALSRTVWRVEVHGVDALTGVSRVTVVRVAADALSVPPPSAPR
ncbi:MAG: hypothetical protein IT361_11095 [Gemmatimonadaceae bacterium]|nr:hypothetical protein [Gemmatimonadaceae bacterium]